MREMTSAEKDLLEQAERSFRDEDWDQVYVMADRLREEGWAKADAERAAAAAAAAAEEDEEMTVVGEEDAWEMEQELRQQKQADEVQKSVRAQEEALRSYNQASQSEPSHEEVGAMLRAALQAAIEADEAVISAEQAAEANDEDAHSSRTASPVGPNPWEDLVYNGPASEVDMEEERAQTPRPQDLEMHESTPFLEGHDQLTAADRVPSWDSDTASVITESSDAGSYLDRQDYMNGDAHLLGNYQRPWYSSLLGDRPRRPY